MNTCDMIDNLQVAFRDMQRLVESYNSLFQYWTNQDHSLVNSINANAMYNDLNSILNVVKTFNTAGSLICFTSVLPTKNEANETENCNKAVNEVKIINEPSNTLQDYQTREFNFSKILLEEGDAGKCLISFVDENKGLINMTVVSPENLKMFSSLEQECLKNGEYQWIPPSNTIFGYHDIANKAFFRAVCVNNNRKFSDDKIDIFLVDFGQYDKIDTVGPFYKLSGNYSSIPAQARVAKLLNVDGYPFDEWSDKLRTDDHFNFKVVEVTNNIICINLMTEKTNNPSALDDSDILLPSNDFDLSAELPLPPPAFRSSNSGSSSMKSVPHNGCDFKHEAEENFMFNDDEDEEELTGTSNALKAVMGFVPRDDRDYCQFFDPKTLSCFKGAHCRKVHLPLDENGITQDTQTVRMSIASPTMPTVGDEIQGFITCVVNPEICYAHFTIGAVPKLFLLNDHISRLVEENALQPINHTLNKFDLVTAFYDGHWYRAQVVDFPAGQKYRVRYMDYGNTAEVTKNDLRKWCSEYDHTPFFAHRVRIANIATIEGKIVAATKHLQKALMGGTQLNMNKITMNVISVDPEIRMTFIDADGFDVGESMIALELVNPRQI
ncbi:uncharacterized protein LOC132258935 [Phlebotomus argentipes]|uniref:uncharacterized protein LOC132258935 n=1 Tax=Phlebotomus argentipes TaxID=94469 RepID=UPI0028937078|nr:uncharacterized protein LOC132258935 [Phlebotomus argentipes]